MHPKHVGPSPSNSVARLRRRTGFRANLGATVLLASACAVSHAPARRDPFSGLERPWPPALKTLRLALVVSENTKQLLERFREGEAVQAAHGVKPASDPLRVLEASIERFRQRFSSVVRIDQLAQAKGLDVDLVVVWDNFVNMSGALGQKIEVERGAIFVTVDGEQVENLRVSASREMSISDSSAAALAAVEEAESRFDDALRGSTKLVAFAERRAATTARPVAVTTATLRTPSRMVVGPLRAAGGVSAQVCGLLTNYMLSLLDRVDGLRTVGQADIEAMLGLERQKDILGCTSTACAAEIGGALGADLFLYGEVGKVGSSYAVNMTVVRTATSSVGTRVSRMTAQNEDSLRAEIPAMVAEMVDRLNATP